MKSTLVYGIVNKNKFYSDNMEVNLKIEDGIYSIDVASDEYLDSIKPADIFEFESYIKNKPKMEYIIGLSFKQVEVIPMNYIKWQKRNNLPIIITNENLVMEDWNLVKILHIPSKNIFFFTDYVYGSLFDTLQEVKNYYDNSKNLVSLTGVIPEMRLLYTFHHLEKLKIEEEIRKAKEAEYRKTVVGRVEKIIQDSGGTFLSVKSYQKGYIVDWELNGNKINTLMNQNFGIIEAGFCLSGGDRKHTLNSITKLLGDYVSEGFFIHKTRT